MEGIPDYLDYKLKIVFIGFNPGLTSASKGHHYASPTNRFWKLLYDSGLTDRLYEPEEDFKLLNLKYGLTNIVHRPTKRATEISREEYDKGRIVLIKKLKKYKPEVVCYTGIGVYRYFSKRRNFTSGWQEDNQIEGIKDFVVSSPSGLNRTPYEQQLLQYIKLKEYLTNSDEQNSDE